jgi:hypothetical protein
MKYVKTMAKCMQTETKQWQNLLKTVPKVIEKGTEKGEK